jgi:glutamine synthetase
MQALRSDIDAIEMLVPRDMWPIPTYVDLLFKL